MKWLNDKHHPPLLHFTVWLTRVIDETAHIAHPVAVNHHSTVEVEAVMMALLRVFFRHSASKLLFTDNFSKIFRYKLSWNILHQIQRQHQEHLN